MVKKEKNAIPPKQAFESIYGNPRARLPQELEDKLLDAFSDYCEDTGQQELYVSELPSFLKKYLNIPNKLIQSLNLHDFALEGDETLTVVDFEKYLSRGGLLLTLSQKDKLSVVDYYWRMIMRASGQLDESTKTEDVSTYSKTFNLKNLKDLATEANDESPPSLLIKMIATGSGSGKSSLTYLDFAVLLGRIGELGLDR